MLTVASRRNSDAAETMFGSEIQSVLQHKYKTYTVSSLMHQMIMSLQWCLTRKIWKSEIILDGKELKKQTTKGHGIELDPSKGSYAWGRWSFVLKWIHDFFLLTVQSISVFQPSIEVLSFYRPQNCSLQQCWHQPFRHLGAKEEGCVREIQDSMKPNILLFQLVCQKSSSPNEPFITYASDTMKGLPDHQYDAMMRTITSQL
jgi:hypothetical protein